MLCGSVVVSFRLRRCGPVKLMSGLYVIDSRIASISRTTRCWRFGIGTSRRCGASRSRSSRSNGASSRNISAGSSRSHPARPNTTCRTPGALCLLLLLLLLRADSRARRRRDTIILSEGTIQESRHSYAPARRSGCSICR